MNNTAKFDDFKNRTVWEVNGDQPLGLWELKTIDFTIEPTNWASLDEKYLNIVCNYMVIQRNSTDETIYPSY